MKFSILINYIKQFDWLTFVPVFILILIGLASLYSQNISMAQSDLTLFNKQLTFFTMGIILMFVLSAVDFRFWRTYGITLFLLANILMILVLIWGTTIRGTTGWFNFFGFTFQPVELAKIGLVVVLALIYNRRKGKEKTVLTYALVGVATMLPAVLAMLQPDFGSAMVLVGIGFGFFALISMERKHFLLIIIGLTTLSLLVWNFALVDYQKDRIMTFIDPNRDPLGQGYNVRQSIIAVGSGELSGRGLGLGTQSQLQFLPEVATDFIFATIAESLGFWGAGLLIVLFTWLLLRLIIIMQKSRSSFGMYLIYGFGIIFFIHTIVNIGMNIGIMPVTGISLPFVSYGGSFLLMCLTGMGIVESVSIRSKTI